MGSELQGKREDALPMQPCCQPDNKFSLVLTDCKGADSVYQCELHETGTWSVEGVSPEYLLKEGKKEETGPDDRVFCAALYHSKELECPFGGKGGSTELLHVEKTAAEHQASVLACVLIA